MPRPDHLFSFSLTRRDVLLAAGAGAAGLLLPGCGGGGGKKSEASPPVELVGSYNAAEILASEGLSVTNVFSLSAPVSAEGRFATLTSSKRAMPNFLVDGDDTLIAAGFSRPSEPLVFGAESSLLAALFLAPGIMVQQPDSVDRVRQELQSLSSYQAALSYFRSNLPTRPLQALLQDPLCQQTLYSCVSEYLEPRQNGRSVIKRGIEIGPETDGFSLRDSGRPRAFTKMHMKNDAWRVIRIDRLRFDANDQEILPRTRPVKTSGPEGYFFHLMDGKKPFSVEEIALHLVTTSPTELDDGDNLDLSTVARTEYWIQGMGDAPQLEFPLPEGLENFSVAAYCATILHYVIYPFIAIVLAGASLLADVLLKLGELVKKCLEDPVLVAELQTIVQIFQSGRTLDQKIIDITPHVKKLLAAVFSKEFQADLFTVIEEVLKKLNKYSQFFFIPMNMLGICNSVSGNRPYNLITVRSSGNGEIIVK